MQLDRRTALKASLWSGVALGASGTASAAGGPRQVFTPKPVPSALPMQERLIEVHGARLWCRDSGGTGPAVVLMHPASGSALNWDYQAPALTQAGFRVIAYSRRGHHGSDPADAAAPSTPSNDLQSIVEKLGVGRFSIVAAAAGCSVALDFALSRSDRLNAVVFSCGSFSGIDEPDYVAMSRRVLVKGFEAMPPEFKELGPSYRASDPDGVKAWLDLEHKAVTGERRGVRNANVANWNSIAKIAAPTLFIAGAADLYAPPAQVWLVASRVPNAEMVVFPECGHSPHWEMPDAFNESVVGFLQAHAR